jgi:hypothetical protein
MHASVRYSKVSESSGHPSRALRFDPRNGALSLPKRRPLAEGGQRAQGRYRFRASRTEVRSTGTSMRCPAVERLIAELAALARKRPHFQQTTGIGS